MSNEKEYSTSDLFLATYLKSIGYELKNMSHVGSKVTFIFNEDEQREKRVFEYYNGKGSIEPLSFVRSYKDLKGIIYNVK